MEGIGEAAAEVGLEAGLNPLFTIGLYAAAFYGLYKFTIGRDKK